MAERPVGIGAQLGFGIVLAIGLFGSTVCVSKTINAKDRADEFAKTSSSCVGRLMSGRQGTFQVTPQNSTDLSDTGMHDTSTIDKVVKIVVNLSYATN